MTAGIAKGCKGGEVGSESGEPGSSFLIHGAQLPTTRGVVMMKPSWSVLRLGIGAVVAYWVSTVLLLLLATAVAVAVDSLDADVGGGVV